MFKEIGFELGNLQIENGKLKQENEELKENIRHSCRYYAPGGECALTAHNCYGTEKCIVKLQQKLEKIKGLLITCKNNFEKPCAECKYSDQCSEIDTDSYILQIIERY